jgi:hypothetical protein
VGLGDDADAECLRVVDDSTDVVGDMRVEDVDLVERHGMDGAD